MAGVGSLRNVSLADFNGDGLDDMIGQYFIQNPFEQIQIAYFERIPNGLFSEPIDLIPASAGSANLWPGGMDVLDINDDGHLDIVGVYGHEFSGLLVTLINEGDGTFDVHIEGDDPTESPWQSTSDYAYTSLPVAFEDGLTKGLRFVASHYCGPLGQNGFNHHLMDVYASSESEELSSTSEPIQITTCQVDHPGQLFDIVRLADIDGDAIEETFIVSTNYISGGYYYQVIMVDQFGESSYLQFDTHPEDLRFFDMDDDGDQDMLILMSSSLFIRYNDGNGQFSEIEALIEQGIGGAYDIGDVDSDGDLDILMMRGALELYLNNGSGEFSTPKYIQGDFEGIRGLQIAATPTVPGQRSYAVGYDNWQDQINGRYYLILLENTCPSDISGDGITDVDDFIMFNSAFGSNCSDCPEDMNDDGQVDIDDFLVLNSAFGESCY